MFVRKDTAGAAPGFTWHIAGDVVEVPDDFGRELLEIPKGGFTEVAPHEVPTPEPEAAPEPETAEEGLTRGQKAALTRAANKAAAAADAETAQQAVVEESVPAVDERPSEDPAAPVEPGE
jgi:hypothetical protein